MASRWDAPEQHKMDIEYAKKTIKESNGSLDYIRTCIAKLPEADLVFLEKELKAWIREDLERNGPPHGRHYGLPYLDSLREIPEDVTALSNYLLRECGMDLDYFTGSGLPMCRQIFMMIKRGIRENKEGYNEKFHHFVCNEFAEVDFCPYKIWEQ